jgi:hypothetical protein
MALNFLTAL